MEEKQVNQENADDEKKPFDFSSHHTDNFPQLLHGLNISLVVTSYQSQKLFFIRSDGEKIDTNFKAFPRPMGLSVSEDQITLGIFKEVLKFNRNDSIILDFDDADQIDACYTPGASHTTGMINIHDIAYGDEGLWVVNSAFSCLATLESDYSFVPRWKPPFISELKPEDRCHLNGMALKDGRPKYVTTFNQLNEAGAWRKKQDKANKDKESKKINKHDGTLIDVDSNEILLEGLIMPHSPRYYNGQVYFCESGKGLVCRYNPDTREVTVLQKLQGFTRGIDFHGPLMFVGLSKTRKSEVANPAPINTEYDETFSGIWVINLENNEMIAYVNFEGDVDQIYDVAVLTNMHYPELIEPGHKQVPKIFNFPNTL